MICLCSSVQFDGILAVHEFHVWRLAGQKIIATVHVRFRSLHDYMEGADKVILCLGMGSRLFRVAHTQSLAS